MADDIPTTNIAPNEPTPAPETSLSATESSSGTVVVAMVGQPTPSPDQLQLLPQPLSTANSDSTSPHADHNDVMISCRPPTGHGGTNAETELFISTPSPFKNQKSALAGDNAIDDKSERKNSFDVNDSDPLRLSRKASTSSDPKVRVVGSPSESNFQCHHLLSGSLLQSPDPLLGNNDASNTNFDFLGQEVMAAASTASAMLSRYDGFDLPAYSGGKELFDGAPSTLTIEPIDELGVNLFSQYPYQYQDAFPLPPYLQVHLDETHAESTAIIVSGYDGGSETGKSPMNGYDQTTVPGTTPPSVSSRPSSTEEIRRKSDKVVSRGKTLEQLEQTKKNAKNAKNDKTRPRPLPLRKRKIVMNDSDDDEYQPPTTSSEFVMAPAGKKRTLVRHNVRPDDGDRITCKCSKSKFKVSYFYVEIDSYFEADNNTLT